jgi:hypothetical protein
LVESCQSLLTQSDQPIPSIRVVERKPGFHFFNVGDGMVLLEY